MPDLTVPASALVDIAAEIVGAYVANDSAPLAEVPGLIAIVHRTLADLGRPVPKATPEAKPTPAVTVKKSIFDDHLVTQENGKRYRSLKRHLFRLGLAPNEYRMKWGLPHGYPMVCLSYTRAQSELAKTMWLGQKLRKRAEK